MIRHLALTLFAALLFASDVAADIEALATRLFPSAGNAVSFDDDASRQRHVNHSSQRWALLRVRSCLACGARVRRAPKAAAAHWALSSGIV